MSFLPIVGRELRGASRRRGTYWTRTAVAGLAVLTGVIIFLATLGMSTTSSGEIIFEGLAGLLFLYCLVAGRRFTVDCVSVEKREGTLGLLFLTDLKGYDVVLGKLVATSWNGFYGLLAVMPVLSFSMLLGGISYAEFWRTALVLADTFLFSLAIGIFSSAISRDARRATSANFGLLLLFLGVLPAVMGIIAFFNPRHPPIMQLFYTCPIFPFALGFDALYKLYPADFWWSAGVIHALTWLLVLLASMIVPRTWQDQPARTEKAPVRNFWRAFNFGPAAGRAPFRKRLLDVNAFYWLAGRARFKPLHVWIFLAAMAAWWLWGLFSAGRFAFDPAMVMVLGLMVNSTFKLWVTLEASQQLGEDQRTGTLELLLPTPLRVRDIVHGQWLALRRQFIWPLAAAIAAEIILSWVAAHNQYNHDDSFLYTAAAGMVMLVADLLALRWVAMRLALTAKSTSRAAVGTVTRILILPWVVFGAVMLVISVWNILWPDAELRPGWKLSLGLWFGLGMAADLWFGLSARHQLLTGFYRLAMHRFEAKATGGLARWFGGGTEAETKPTAAVERPLRVAWWRRKAVIGGAFIMLLLTTGYLELRNPGHKYPPPVVVAITQSNTPLFVLPGQTTFLVLPDGSLWRWGLNASGRPSEVEVPEQVGSDRDWARISGENYGGMALKQDGALWEWGGGGNLSVRGTEMHPSGKDRDWVSIARSPSHSLAVKKDGSLWAWGNNTANQLGIGTGTNQTNAIQVGTDHDWAAVNARSTFSLGLRADGTLWEWGRMYTSAGGMTLTYLAPVQTRVSRETNWTSLDMAFSYGVWNSAGELWEMPTTAPKSAAGIAATGRLILEKSGPGRVAIIFTDTRASMLMSKVYQVRDNGTLWENDIVPGYLATISPNPWRRVGKRSDWVSVWGRMYTALGVTADGTIWTWGMDYSRIPTAPFSERVKELQGRILQIFRNTTITAAQAMPPIIETPRPLMRMVGVGAGISTNGNGR